ncbi:MAG: hypothetical protein ACLP5E_24675 [Streptosporangiaceae bacterium]
MAGVRVVVRYRRAVSYGLHAPLAALEMAGTDCGMRLGVTAGTARSGSRLARSA